jgi:hypothetical protein
MTVPHMFALMATGGAGGGGISSPDEIAGLYNWYDAADTGTITSSGGKVSTWADKGSATLNLSQTVGDSVRPTTAAATQNGLNVLSFDGGDYVRRSASWLYSLATTTIFVVWRSTVTGTQVVLGEGATTNTNSAYRLGALSQNWWANSDRDTGAANFTASSGVDICDSAYHVCIFDDSSTLARVWADQAGTPDGTSGAYTRGTTTLNRTAAGAQERAAVTLQVTGNIAEILVYDSVLSDDDRALVFDYLVDKWGL